MHISCSMLCSPTLVTPVLIYPCFVDQEPFTLHFICSVSFSKDFLKFLCICQTFIRLKIIEHGLILPQNSQLDFPHDQNLYYIFECSSQHFTADFIHKQLVFTSRYLQYSVLNALVQPIAQLVAMAFDFTPKTLFQYPFVVI